MTGQQWPEYVPPVCDHPETVETQRLCDPHPDIRCTTCNQQVDTTISSEGDQP